MVEMRSGNARGAASQGPLIITALAALVVGAAIAAVVFLATGGGGPVVPEPTPGPSLKPQHTIWIVVDPKKCEHSDCVCATPNYLPASRKEDIEWINATSAEVTITPSKSDTFVGSTGPAGSVNVADFDLLTTTISDSLNVGDIIQMNLTLEGDLELCEGYQGPRMEIDN